MVEMTLPSLSLPSIQSLPQVCNVPNYCSFSLHPILSPSSYSLPEQKLIQYPAFAGYPAYLISGSSLTLSPGIQPTPL